MKNKILPLIILAIISISLLIYWQTRQGQLAETALAPPYLTIGGETVKATVSDTPAKRERGLSGSEELCDHCGMIFLFEDMSVQNFWMKDMNYPLDIIWIQFDKIVGISKNLPPEGANPSNIYSSEKPVNKVLEVSAGFTDKYNISVGSTIKFNLK